jgi:hypothetical protein
MKPEQRFDNHVARGSEIVTTAHVALFVDKNCL